MIQEKELRKKDLKRTLNYLEITSELLRKCSTSYNQLNSRTSEMLMEFD